MNGKWILCAGVAALAFFLGGPLAKDGRADFTLWNDEQLTVDTSHSYGTLYDESSIRIVSGGKVDNTLSAYNNSIVDISGGNVCGDFYLYNTSTVNISTGSVSGYSRRDFYAYDTSIVNMSGGDVNLLYAEDDSTVNISGGSIREYLNLKQDSVANISGGEVHLVEAFNHSTANISGGEVDLLGARDYGSVNISGGQVHSLSAHRGSTSTVTFIARDFRLGDGLSLDGDRVLGIGLLSGEWYDGTRWAVDIYGNGFTVGIDGNYYGATILAVPEPATLSLLALGGLALTLRKRNR